MSHYAKIINGIVTDVIVADQEFIDSGAVGNPTQWIQTSYNASIRKNYAGIGYLYNEELDIFIEPKPFQSWLLDIENGTWKAPVDKPDDNKNYIWNEESLSWEESTNPLPGV
jgi:hypothetical protein